MFDQSIDPSYWEGNLPGEKDIWFRRFRSYLSMPRRSILGAFNAEEVAQGKPNKSPRVPGSWNQAVDKFEWKQRAKAFDESIWKEDEARYRKWKYEAILRMQSDVDLCSIKATEMLSRSLDEERISEDGLTVTRLPAKWTMADAIRAKVAAKELLVTVVGLREPEVDLIQAIKRFIEEGLLDPEALGEVQEGWQEFTTRIKTLKLDKSPAIEMDGEVEVET